MADDPKNGGKADRDRVSTEKHEIDPLVAKHGLARDVVLKAIQDAGPMRDAVEKKLAQLKATT